MEWDIEMSRIMFEGILNLQKAGEVTVVARGGRGRIPVCYTPNAGQALEMSTS